jgi:hypothetical protein
MRAKRAIRFARKKRGRFAQRAQVLRSAESTLLRMTSLEKPHKSLAVPRMAKPGLAQAGSGSQKGRMQ